MGWTLVQTSTQQQLVLRPGTALVGRAQGAQIRTTHQSVSRSHADIVVDRSTGLLSDVTPAPIFIIDRSSTGHTFINERPTLGTGKPTPLADGDLLAFGVDPVTYTVRWSPVVLSYSSRISAQETQGMEVKARDAGAFLTPEWTPNCTHLIMEQLAITPKLLCCIADGGIPVAISFLHAIAACDPGGLAPDPSAHRPRPPVGVDAAYEAKLMACIKAPWPRRSMLQGVWIIFGLKQAYDALSIALLHAGSQVHLLCTTEVQAMKVVEDLRKSSAASAAGTPREVWLVPSIDEQFRTLLAAPLSELGVQRCLIVTHGAVVSGILAGSLEAVHAEAMPCHLCTTSPEQDEAKQPTEQSFPATQEPSCARRRVERRTLPWGGGGPSCASGGVAVVKKEEPGDLNTGLHAEAPAPAAPGGLAGGCTGREAGRKRLASELPAGAAPEVRRREGAGRPIPREAGPTEPAAPAMAGAALLVAKIEPELRGGMPKPGSTSQQWGKLQQPAPAAAPPTTAGMVTSLAMPSAPAVAASVVVLSQAKDEPVPEPAGAPRPGRECKVPIVESSDVVKGKEDAEGNFVTAAEPGPDAHIASPPPTKHPTGVWLQTLAAGQCQLPASSFNPEDIQRAPWRPGAEATPSKAVAGMPRRGFKLFSKSPGQLPRAQSPIEPLKPWAPAAGPPLSEIFCSQPVDSQSQLSPILV